MTLALVLAAVLATDGGAPSEPHPCSETSGEVVAVQEAAIRVEGVIHRRDGGYYLDSVGGLRMSRCLAHLKAENESLKAAPTQPGWVYLGALLVGVTVGLSAGFLLR